MEINKQLFEDVLLGKLKGTFVLRNGDKYDSSKLYRNITKMKSQGYPYALYVGNYVFSHYIPNGKNSTLQVDEYDIIDFIPDTDMKENELTIEIPNEKLVDWDESKKQNKIVLKDKQLTYEDVCKKLFENKLFFTDSGGSINHSVGGTSYYCANNSATKHQLECILAKNQLANIAVYFNDGWKPTVGDSYTTLEYFYKSKDVLAVPNVWYGESSYEQIIFHNEEDAWKAIKILGKETVKLALEPLGI